MIDISGLDHILSIDKKAMTAVVEPNVPMDKLINATLREGLIPPIVMEFPGITVGGGIQGNGGESSSFKWGAFNQIFNWHEIILANGDVLKASSNNNSDLFHGVPGSAGTLGILTSAEIQLIPAKQFVALSYIVVTSFTDAKKVIDQEVKKKHDFVDGIMFSKQQGVVIVGVLTDEVDYKVERFSRARDQWYYLHVENQLAHHSDGWSETVPLKEYLFRYDRGAFWVGRFAFKMFGIPYTRFMRWLLNPILHTRKLYQALQESGASQQHVVQDLVIPGEKSVEFLEFTDVEIGTYPLWLCPMRVDNQSPFQLNNISSTSILNVGVWGDLISDYSEFIAKNKQIEARVLELGGKKWSYAHSYFTERQFWSMYDKNYYNSLREKYHASRLPTIYDKVTVKNKVAITKRKAVIKTLFGVAKLRIKS
jgi:FAD/FMN-containing dehydrogenase